MPKVVISLIFLTFSLSAFADIDSSQTANLLYPTMEQEKRLLKQYFDVVESHRSQDPFFEKSGPSISGYSLDGIRFGIIFNENSDAVDLALFNWDLEIVSGLMQDQDLSQAYGSPVYVYKGIKKIGIGTQGPNLDQLSNFSYLLGADHAGGDWKPHPNYLDRDHPLRIALKGFNLPLIHPSKAPCRQVLQCSSHLKELVRLHCVAKQVSFKHALIHS